MQLTPNFAKAGHQHYLYTINTFQQRCYGYRTVTLTTLPIAKL